jgi:hypothetical protein
VTNTPAYNYTELIMAVINFIILAQGHNIKRNCSKLDHFRAGRKKMLAL